MKKYWLLLIILLSSIFCYLYFYKSICEYKFIKIHSFSEADLKCDSNTLITFDIDDTLITTEDILAKLEETPFIFKVLTIIHHPYLIIPKNFAHISSIIFDQAHRKLTEPDNGIFINKLKANGCKVIGLTSIQSGSWGIIENMIEWRYNMLESMNIRFSNQFKDVVFYNLQKRVESHPTLYKGIIFTNLESKGKTLGAVIDMQKEKPNRIISFDDEETALCSIAQLCQERKIEFIGYHYLGADIKAKKFVNKRALLQLDYVYKYNKWLTDKQADAILNLT